MHILVDGIIYSSDVGGVSNTFTEILPRLAKMPGTEIQLIAPKALWSPTPTLNGTPGGRPPEKTAPRRNFPLRGYLSQAKSFFEHAKIQLSLLGTKEVIFHSTYFTDWAWPHIPQVLTLYDMTHENFKNYFSSAQDDAFRARKRRCISRATRIIAISNFTKKDLCAVAGVDPSQVDVAHLATDNHFFASPVPESDRESLRKKWGIDRPFVLYVGRRWGYKNFSTLLESFAQSPLRKSHSLMVAGPIWSQEEQDAARALGIQDCVRSAHYPNNEELRALYQMSDAFVYPSLAEGFGVPLLESMAAGTPVVASDLEVFREVAGDAAEFFPALDPTALARALEKVLDPARAAQLREKGRANTQKYSWDLTARRHWECYQKVLND